MRISKENWLEPCLVLTNRRQELNVTRSTMMTRSNMIVTPGGHVLVYLLNHLSTLIHYLNEH